MGLFSTDPDKKEEKILQRGESLVPYATAMARTLGCVFPVSQHVSPPTSHTPQLQRRIWQLTNRGKAR